MANLGDNNTPVEGESFGLPSGFSIDEDSGNLAIRDTNGNVVAKWDEGNTQWDFANNTLNNVDALNSDSVNTEELNTEEQENTFWASQFDGGSVDERLSNVLTVVEFGSTIVLENGRYADDETFDKRLQIVGEAARGSFDHETETTWTLDGPDSLISHARLRGTVKITLNATRCTAHLTQLDSGSDIIISADECILYDITGAGDITFESDTEGGEVGLLGGKISATDNGNNRIL